MDCGKFETTKKRMSPVTWILVILVILGAATSGVAAYLSTASNPVTNNFDNASHPVVQVNGDNSITVQDLGYAVYLRAAVVVNWKNQSNDNIFAQTPVEGESRDYTLALGKGWKKIGEFYYYTSKIQENKTTAPVVTIIEHSPKAGYTLDVTVVTQVIQAVGQTDGNNPVDAVQDAWGVTEQAITATGP